MHPGPVNRGVELSAEVIDSPQALITDQVESGVVVRMAVLYELLAGGGGSPAPGRGRSPLRPRSPSPRDRPRGADAEEPGGLDRFLDHAGGPAADLLVRAAHLLDPRAGLDGPGDLLVRGGVVAEIGAPGALEPPDDAEVVDAEGLHAFPGFVDPHVHLRTPGREDEEDIETGTRSAAAGGYCAILAMPNTDPVVDSASVLRSLRERARAEARVPTGFTAAVTVGQRGEQLTEMAELAEAGAVAFTDDGLPLRSAGVMRQALQYQRLAGRCIALHEEDPSLSGSGVMHEGEVSALLGLAGIPSVSESTMVARDTELAAYEDGRIHVQHVSARETVEVLERAQGGGRAVTAEATPHHLLLTDECVRSLDTHFKMNPPLRSEADRQALIDGLRSGVLGCIATDHAPHSREEKEQPFEAAPMGVTGLETAFAAVHTELVVPGVLDLGAGRRAADRRRRAVRALDPHAGGRRPGQRLPRRPRLGVGGGGGRLREPLRQLRLRRPAAHRPRADDDRRRRRGLPRALLRDRGGGDDAGPGARPRARRARGGRRPGGLPPRGARLRAGGAQRRRAGPGRPGARRAGGRHRAVPARARLDRARGGRAPGRRPSRSRRPCSPPRRPTASTSAGATRRCCAGSSPTCACPRPPTTCSTAASRCTWRGTRSARAPRRTAELGLHKMEGAGAVLTSVETALFELLGAAGSEEFKAVQGLVK